MKEFKINGREQYRALKWNTNYLISNRGSVFSLYSMRLIGNIDSQGYRNVCIEGKHHTVHRLVYSTWVGEIPAGYTINHRSGVKTQNYVANLELMTIAENVKHANDILGLRKKANFHHMWRGLWVVNGQKFITLQKAVDGTGLCIETIRLKCKKGANGFDFIPSEQQRQLTA